MTSRNPRDVRLLTASVGLSALGDLVLAIPLVLEVRERTGSPFAVAMFFLALFGPIAVAAPLAGRLVDSVENRKLMLVVSVAQAIVTAGVLLDPSVEVLLCLTALLGTGAAIVAPAEFSLVPVAAGADHVATANGHIEAARYLGMTAGPLLGGVLAAGGLLHLAALLDIASFAAVGLVAAVLHARREPSSRRVAGDSGRARDGARALTADRALRVALTTAIGALICLSISLTAELFFAVDVLHAGQAGYGALLAAWTCGMVIGAAVLARRVPAHRLALAAVVGIAVQGAGLLGASLTTALVAALAGFALGGLAHGIKNVALRTLIHERVPDALRGRAYATYNGARNTAELGALALGGVLVGALGARDALLLSGAIPLALGLIGLLLIQRTARGAAADLINPRSTLHAHVEG
jgi:MFS family permease